MPSIAVEGMPKLATQGIVSTSRMHESGYCLTFGPDCSNPEKSRRVDEPGGRGLLGSDTPMLMAKSELFDRGK